MDSRMFSNSTKETVPLRYKLQTQENDVGSDISRVLGTRSRTWPVSKETFRICKFQIVYYLLSISQTIFFIDIDI